MSESETKYIAELEAGNLDLQRQLADCRKELADTKKMLSFAVDRPIYNLMERQRDKAAKELAEAKAEIERLKMESHTRLGAIIIMRQALFEISSVNCKNGCDKIAGKALKDTNP